MPELSVLHPRAHEELILIGFRVDGGHDGPQFYTLLAVGGDDERPLASDGRIVFFARPGLAAQAPQIDPSLKRNDERPLASDGRIVFFARPGLAAKALALDPSMARLGPPPDAIETFCDIAEALYRVNSQQADQIGR